MAPEVKDASASPMRWARRASIDASAGVAAAPKPAANRTPSATMCVILPVMIVVGGRLLRIRRITVFCTAIANSIVEPTIATVAKTLEGTHGTFARHPDSGKDQRRRK